MDTQLGEVKLVDMSAVVPTEGSLCDLLEINIIKGLAIGNIETVFVSGTSTWSSKSNSTWSILGKRHGKRPREPLVLSYPPVESNSHR